MKAHVDDTRAVVEKIREFAAFRGCQLKDDVYWGDSQRPVQLRIRRETALFALDGVFGTGEWRWPFAGKDGIGSAEALRPLVGEPSGEESVFATYKQKQVVSDSCEVNQEEEFQVSDKAALEHFLQAAGFSVVLKKQKLVAAWDWGGCGIELCHIPELGDFLELEILSDTEDEAVVATCQRQLREVLRRCGVGEEAIESRFYCQLLEEARGEAVQTFT